jgi:hypothetical protein
VVAAPFNKVDDVQPAGPVGHLEPGRTAAAGGAAPAGSVSTPTADACAAHLGVLDSLCEQGGLTEWRA